MLVVPHQPHHAVVDSEDVPRVPVEPCPGPRCSRVEPERLQDGVGERRADPGEALGAVQVDEGDLPTGRARGLHAHGVWQRHVGCPPANPAAAQ
eukprot:7490650-Alexandrium_andersonii.AAC.1